jgi:hypothetical protein
MTESKNLKRAGIKRVPRPQLIDPNQRYSLAETHAGLGQSHVKTFQDIKRGACSTPSRTVGGDTFWGVS